MRFGPDVSPPVMILGHSRTPAPTSAIAPSTAAPSTIPLVRRAGVFCAATGMAPLLARSNRLKSALMSAAPW